MHVCTICMIHTYDLYARMHVGTHTNKHAYVTSPGLVQGKGAGRCRYTRWQAYLFGSVCAFLEPQTVGYLCSHYRACHVSACIHMVTCAVYCHHTHVSGHKFAQMNRCMCPLLYARVPGFSTQQHGTYSHEFLLLPPVCPLFRRQLPWHGFKHAYIHTPATHTHRNGLAAMGVLFPIPPNSTQSTSTHLHEQAHNHPQTTYRDGMH
jgi:hypothetical protein